MQWFNQLKAKIMRKSYISPASETMMVNSVSTICAASATKSVSIQNMNGFYDDEADFK